MALPPAGAEPPLGPTGGIGIVVDRDGQPDPVEQGVAQRLLTPGQVRREDDGGAISPDEPGGSDADGAHLAGPTWAIRSSTTPTMVLSTTSGEVDR